MDKTIAYYNKNAERFVRDTETVEFTEVQDRFLKYMPKGAYILDFGCGSGRDTYIHRLSMVSLKGTEMNDTLRAFNMLFRAAR